MPTPKTNFPEAVEKILQTDRRYDMEAYFFTRDALDHTVRSLGKPVRGPRRHVTGRELLEGIRAYALQEFGPVALRVLNSWGVNQTDDFGQIVFNLVEQGVLGKTDDDRREDFANVYDFYQAFAMPFQPRSKRAAKKKERELPKPGGL